MAGQATPCYKVRVEIDGRPVEGYISPELLDQLDEFDNARRQAAPVGTREVMSAVRPRASLSSGSVAEQAAALMEASQPAQALALLEPELKKGEDADLLALAGAAAWRADDVRRALDYWGRSLTLKPNAQLAALYKNVEREAAGDQSNQRLVGSRVLLRYEGTSISPETAREMAAVVDQEFSRISAELGCYTRERIVAIAQSREAYQKTTGAAEWSGGQYDGRIRVPVFDKGSLDPATRRALAHETAHACLALLGSWPSWLHEGVAQHVSGDKLLPAMRSQISEMAKQKQIPSLDKLAGGWGGMDSRTAGVAYAIALRAVEIFQQDMGGYGLRNLFRNPEKLPQITAELDRRLAQ
jgi:hypothetical protein